MGAAGARRLYIGEGGVRTRGGREVELAPLDAKSSDLSESALCRRATASGDSGGGSCCCCWRMRSRVRGEAVGRDKGRAREGSLATEAGGETAAGAGAWRKAAGGVMLRTEAEGAGGL